MEGESAAGWRDCRVIDISMLGLGMTFHYPWASNLVGRRVFVEVPAVCDSVNVRLEGEIKNAATLRGGNIRVGVELGRLEAENMHATRSVTASNLALLGPQLDRGAPIEEGDFE